MTFYNEKKALKNIVPFLVEKAINEGFTAVKFPFGKTVRFQNGAGASSTEKDSKGIDHKVSTGSYTSSYFGSKAFNKAPGDYWQNPTVATNWITYDFGVNNATVVNAYFIQAMPGDRRQYTAMAPKKWTVYGSNEDLGTNTVWTPLDMRDNVTDWRFQEKRYFKFSNSTAYRYYKFEISQVNAANSTVSIGQIELFDMVDLTRKPDQISAAYLISNGSSTFDKVNLYIDSGDCYNNDITLPYGGNSIYVATVESFDPSTLEQRNMFLDNYYISRTTAAYQNNINILVNLYVEISKDRIFFATVMDASAITPANNAAYIGLLKRYSNEGNNSGHINALGTQFYYGNPSVMRNKAGTYYQQLPTRTVSLGYSPSVWGDNIFVSPVFLEGDYEGIRGELEGVYSARVDNLVNEDEILIGSIRYKAIVITSYGSCAFPNNCVVFKLPTTSTS